MEEVTNEDILLTVQREEGRSIYQTYLSYSLRHGGGKEVSISGEEVDAVRTYINANIMHNILDRRKKSCQNSWFYSVNSRIRKGEY